MDLGTIIVSLASSGLVTAGVTTVAGAMRKRRTAPAEITERINAAAMAQVDQLQERVKDAEATADRALRRAIEVEDQLILARREASALAERLAMLARWIHEPTMNIEILRNRVPLMPGMNGAP